MQGPSIRGPPPSGRNQAVSHHLAPRQCARLETEIHALWKSCALHAVWLSLWICVDRETQFFSSPANRNSESGPNILSPKVRDIVALLVTELQSRTR